MAFASTMNRRDQSGYWLKSRSWDLTWISLSAVLMVLPYASYYVGQAAGFGADVSRNVVNVLVAFLIGGPHMYATHTRSSFEPEFRKQHRSLIIAAILIPSFVIYFGIFHFVFLLTLFFFWASVHVLHQIIYLVDCYNGKHRASQNAYSRLIDYAIVLTALYPEAMYRFVHGTFHVGQTYLYFPEFLKVDAVWELASVLFATALTLFIVKTWREFQNGEGNIPKTLLIGITVIVTFITPFFTELDVAFQGLNTWHSFQYLGLTWYINRLRMERGEISLPIMQRISSNGSWWKYYGLNLFLNSTALIIWGVLLVTRSYTGLTFDQSYYIVILCFLLTHYYHDHLLFTQPDELRQTSRTSPLVTIG